MSWPTSPASGPSWPQPGHARVDEARVARAARVGADAEPFGDAGPEAFEQHVGPLAQPQHDLGAAAGA